MQPTGLESAVVSAFTSVSSFGFATSAVSVRVAKMAMLEFSGVAACLVDAAGSALSFFGCAAGSVVAAAMLESRYPPY